MKTSTETRGRFKRFPDELAHSRRDGAVWQLGMLKTQPEGCAPQPHAERRNSEILAPSRGISFNASRKPLQLLTQYELRGTLL